VASILVVCTGNVCRSPIAEGLLRAALRARLGDDAPSVASAGTAGWEGSPADPFSVVAASEHGADISAHRARRLLLGHLEEASLVLAMAGEHRDQVARKLPAVADRTFALKELVRLLEALPPAAAADPGTVLEDRVAQAAALRRGGFEGDRRDEDVLDPLGMPEEAFFAVATELDEWCSRLVDALFGRVGARSAAGG
jgi:protein-tyrosine phosphatase